MADERKIKGIDNIFSATPNNEIQDSLVEFLNWGLLEKGNYFNVTLGELSTDDVDYSTLKLAAHPYLLPGQAWEGCRKNWVWQSGVDYSPAPLVSSDPNYPGVSGVYVDSVFHPTSGTGTYAHQIDHFNGRVIFDNPIPTGSLVQAEYSYKYINVIYSENLPYLRELQKNSLEVDKQTPLVPPEMRVQLPAIAVEIVPRRNFRGYQLGGGQYIYTDVLFHCIAEDAYTRNKLVDIVSMQNEKSVWLLDSDKIAENDAFPIDHFGYARPNAMRYPDLTAQYSDNTITFTKNMVQNLDVFDGSFYAGIVRSTIELIQTNI